MTHTPNGEREAAAPCGDCGMPCTAGEYHPYAACLMFKACHNSATVRANLIALLQSPAAPSSDGRMGVGPLAAEIDAMLDVYMTAAQREAYNRILAAATIPSPAAVQQEDACKYCDGTGWHGGERLNGICDHCRAPNLTPSPASPEVVCPKCRGKGWTEEGDPETGHAPFDCDTCSPSPEVGGLVDADAVDRFCAATMGKWPSTSKHNDDLIRDMVRTGLTAALAPSRQAGGEADFPWTLIASALREYARDIEKEGLTYALGRYAPKSLREWADQCEVQEGFAVTSHPAPSAESAVEAACFRWLCDDIADPEERARRNELLRRMPTMSYAAVCAQINHEWALAAAPTATDEGKAS